MNGSNISTSIPKTAFYSVEITNFSLWIIIHRILASTLSTTAKITELFLGQYLQSLHIYYNPYTGTHFRYTSITTAGIIIGQCSGVALLKRRQVVYANSTRFAYRASKIQPYGTHLSTVGFGHSILKSSVDRFVVMMVQI